MDSEDLESFTLEPESLGECVYKTFSKCNCIQFWREREGDREGEKEGGREGGRERGREGGKRNSGKNLGIFKIFKS